MPFKYQQSKIFHCTERLPCTTMYSVWSIYQFDYESCNTMVWLTTNIFSMWSACVILCGYIVVKSWIYTTLVTLDTSTTYCKRPSGQWSSNTCNCVWSVSCQARRPINWNDQQSCYFDRTADVVYWPFCLQWPFGGQDIVWFLRASEGQVGWISGCYWTILAKSNVWITMKLQL